MSSNQTTLSNFPIKTVIDSDDRFIIYSPTANGVFSITANNLMEPSHIAANGYVMLAGGVMLNWGEVSASNTTPATITFTTPYSTDVFNIQLTGSQTNTAAQATGLTLTGATVVANTTANNTYYYMALGI